MSDAVKPYTDLRYEDCVKCKFIAGGGVRQPIYDRFSADGGECLRWPCPSCGHALVTQTADAALLSSPAEPATPEDLPFPPARGPDVDAESDLSLRDLETTCAACGRPHFKSGMLRDCPCGRHIDAPSGIHCNAALPTPNAEDT